MAHLVCLNCNAILKRKTTVEKLAHERSTWVCTNPECKAEWKLDLTQTAEPVEFVKTTPVMSVMKQKTQPN